MPEEMDNINKEHKAEKVVITFQDGHTESYDTFIALVALGLTPVGKDGNNIVYMAEEDKLQTRAIAHVAAPSEVIAALINSLTELIGNLLSQASPEEALSIMKAILSIKAEKIIEDYTEIRTKEINPREN